jgi:hypothetical protein
VDGGQALLARAFDILGEIVEEHDALRRHADRLYHMIIGGGVRFPKPDRAGQEDFAEMAEHIGVGFREMRDMGPVGVGEGIERQPFGGARQLRIDPGISPAKIVFQPSSNCSSDSPMPSAVRSAAKNSASPACPVS